MDTANKKINYMQFDRYIYYVNAKSTYENYDKITKIEYCVEKCQHIQFKAKRVRCSYERHSSLLQTEFAFYKTT